MGEYRIDGNLVESFHKLASLGHLALRVANFSVAHLASVHALELLEPTSASSLRNRAQLGLAPQSVDISIDLQVQIHGSDVELDDHMHITLSLANMTALLEVCMCSSPRSEVQGVGMALQIRSKQGRVSWLLCLA